MRRSIEEIKYVNMYLCQYLDGWGARGGEYAVCSQSDVFLSPYLALMLQLLPSAHPCCLSSLYTV